MYFGIFKLYALKDRNAERLWLRDAGKFSNAVEVFLIWMLPHVDELHKALALGHFKNSLYFSR